MTAVFDKAGLRFQYPENWTITDENLTDAPQTVSVQVPGGGFWSVMLYDRPAESNALLRETLDEMRREYVSLESSTISDEFEGTVAIGYEMYFYCLDFLVCARVLAMKTPDGLPLLVLWQAEDRDFTTYEPVFRAMTISLLRKS